jgi:hypothetical protein
MNIWPIKLFSRGLAGFRIKIRKPCKNQRNNDKAKADPEQDLIGKRPQVLKQIQHLSGQDREP